MTEHQYTDVIQVKTIFTSTSPAKIEA